MNPAETDRPASSPRCQECAAPVADDQRYCITCGARRGPLPTAIAAIIGQIRERGQNGRVSATQLAAAEMAGTEMAAIVASDEEPEPRRLPPPRSMSVALMAIMAFGVVVGFATQPVGVESLAKTLVLVSPNGQRTTVPATPSPTPSSGSGGGGSAPAPAAPAAAAPAPAAAVPQQQQTITVQAPTPAPAGTTPTTPASTSLLGLPPIKHVFMILLSGQGYNQSFVTTAGHPYLSKTLVKQGELISNYYGVAGSPLANEIALVSGQGPTQQTLADCPRYSSVTPATTSSTDDQVVGDGCIYPAGSLTLADQLSGAGYRWKAYVEGMEDAPPGQSETCRHPPLDAADPDQAVLPGDPYVTWRNPFVYFDSQITGNQCHGDDVGVTVLARDLKQASTTAAFSYIAPSPCDDGSNQPCTTAAPAGLAASEPFLKKVVPEIEASPAYKKDGLIVITFDQASNAAQPQDTTSCCDQPVFPNLPAGLSTSTTPTTPGTPTGSTTPLIPVTPTSSTTPTTPGTPPSSTTPAAAGTPPGGGQVGLLLISRYVKPGSTDVTGTYNHFSLLRSVEDLFALKHLGYAKDPALPEFDASVFNAASK